MPNPRTYLATGIILKKTPFAEADLLINMFSREHGKLRGIVKGAQKSTSRMVGHFEPLTMVEISASKGRTLDTINQAQIVNNFSDLKSNLSLISQGLYVAELLDGFGNESNANHHLYNVAVETLVNINTNPDQILNLRWFEIHLLKSTGFGIEFETCTSCNNDIQPQRHRYSPSHGGLICPECNQLTEYSHPISLQALKVFRLIDRTNLLSLPYLNISDALLLEMKTLLGTTVRYWVDKEIRSNTFMERLERLD